MFLGYLQHSPDPVPVFGALLVHVTGHSGPISFFVFALSSCLFRSNLVCFVRLVSGRVICALRSLKLELGSWRDSRSVVKVPAAVLGPHRADGRMLWQAQRRLGNGYGWSSLAGTELEVNSCVS